MYFIVVKKTSKVTKTARKLHGKFLGGRRSVNIYGRKVDFLLSLCDVELCANKWKLSASENALIRQDERMFA